MSVSGVFDPKAFGRLAQRVVSLLEAHLASAQERELPVLPSCSPEALLAEWSSEFPSDGARAEEAGQGLVEDLGRLLERSIHVHHPGYIGHQISVPIPAASLVEMTNALLSNGMAVYEMGQLQTVMERRVIEFLARCVGFDEQADGVLTHGGSLGNFTALLAARQAKAGYDVWTEGQAQPMSVLVCEQAHYCIARAVQAMGWGAQGAWPVASGDDYRMDLADLPRALAAAREAGRQVVAVVGSACSTATGSFDSLEGIADFCAAEGLWFHVDGAHGASLSFSNTHRSLLKGIERADSVVWDLHKMLGLPALNSAVLFRSRRRSYEAFAQEASYLFSDEAPEDQWFNIGQRTLECTKRAMGSTAYLMFRMLGTAWFGEQVDRLIARTQELHGLLEAADDFETAHRPAANILCFRHLPSSALNAAELSAHQERLRRELLNRGRFYIVQTRLRGELWLRVTVMNPGTSSEELRALIEGLREAAQPSPRS